MSENNINTKIKINKKLILNTSPVNKYNNMTENLNFEKEKQYLSVGSNPTR